MLADPKIGGLYRSITTVLELQPSEENGSYSFPKLGEMAVFLRHEPQFKRGDVYLVLRVVDGKTYLWCGNFHFRFEPVETESAEEIL